MFQFPSSGVIDWNEVDLRPLLAKARTVIVHCHVAREVSRQAFAHKGQGLTWEGEWAEAGEHVAGSGALALEPEVQRSILDEFDAAGDRPHFNE